MKAIILAGGLGTRISEESVLKPKPMIEIGGKPIIWHIMKHYSCHEINDFIICCGYKGYMIKEYFSNYTLHVSDVRISILENKIEVLQRWAEPWTITLVDTGPQTMTGGRLKRVQPYVQDEECFCMTYGDGLSDIDIGDTIRYHKEMNAHATLAAVVPPGRFGALDILDGKVTRFQEKPSGEESMINGGFFVLSNKVFSLLENDETVWERYPLEKLAESGKLAAYRHNGFWHPMDTLRDKMYLEDLWNSGRAPWRKWDE
jgi:glucose-1-phosphate cytidylyltransferase